MDIQDIINDATTGIITVPLPEWHKLLRSAVPPADPFEALMLRDLTDGALKALGAAEVSVLTAQAQAVLAMVPMEK